jgi:hypothetical protein
MKPLPHNAARQYIDAVSAFTALEQAQVEAEQVRGGMYWHKGADNAADYLVRTSASGSEKSLGARDGTTEKIYDAFKARKDELQSRVRGLKEAVDEHRRLNRALRVGRIDPMVTDILKLLDRTDLYSHFRVVGTHAVYAYEAEAGLRVIPAALATRDIDLLWDVRKQMHFATKLGKLDTSMLGLLRKVDPTFRIRSGQKYTAVNKAGFEVDIIRRQAADGDPHPIRLSPDEDDFWVAQAINAHQLLDCASFSSVIVATTGKMARMTAPDPLTFVRFKRWMATQDDRDAKKRERDKLQADIVERIVADYLPHLASAPRPGQGQLDESPRGDVPRG